LRCVPINDPTRVLEDLQAGHQRFLSDTSRHPHCSRERFLEVEDRQHPIAAVLGCADSRVPVELLFGTGFGDLFVVRNAGTMSTGAAIASLEFAVGHLNVALRRPSIKSCASPRILPRWWACCAWSSSPSAPQKTLPRPAAITAVMPPGLWWIPAFF
jgi:hypothetical protein